MAKVKIGDRELSVLEQHEPGSMRVERNVIRARAALREVRNGDDAEAIQDAMVEIVRCYVGHHEIATKEWLLDTLPANPTEILTACIVASGGKVKERQPEGEAARP